MAIWHRSRLASKGLYSGRLIAAQQLVYLRPMLLPGLCSITIAWDHKYLDYRLRGGLTREVFIGKRGGYQSGAITWISPRPSHRSMPGCNSLPVVVKSNRVSPGFIVTTRHQLFPTGFSSISVTGKHLANTVMAIWRQGQYAPAIV